jgi:hypothetical protein
MEQTHVGKWTVGVSSIAALLAVKHPNGRELQVIYMSRDTGFEWFYADSLHKPNVPIPDPVMRVVANHFQAMFDLPADRRQALIDKCRARGPVTVDPDSAPSRQPCCLAEERSLNGGCKTCGDPYL